MIIDAPSVARAFMLALDCRCMDVETRVLGLRIAW